MGYHLYTSNKAEKNYPTYSALKELLLTRESKGKLLGGFTG